MLNNPDFYPTPKMLAYKMASMIDTNYKKRILEPSAGKGDLVEAVKDNGRYFTPKVDCIESDKELQATLLGKGHTLIDSDFLLFNPTRQYDTIIMNPPFSNGVKHVLKAWEIMYNGDIIALLNAETLKNPHSAERKLLNEIIESNGTVEFIENAFIDAERTTGVEVALIHLKKRNSIKTDYFDGLTTSTEHDDVLIQSKSSDLAVPESTIKNMIFYFDEAVRTKTEAVIANEKSKGYSSFFLGAQKDETIAVKDEVTEFVDTLRIAAWREVNSLTEFRGLLTENMRKEFDNNSEAVSNLEFTESNIKKYLKNLMLNRDVMIEDCIEDVFDKLTKYHDENKVHVEGWKSNDYFFVNKRVVLPRMTEMNFSNQLKTHYSTRYILDDMDKVMSHISGIADYVHMSTIVEQSSDLAGGEYHSTFFKMRFYKKGTAHFYFQDLKLLEQFNLIIGRKKRWLPKEDKKVPEEFWLMNN